MPNRKSVMGEEETLRWLKRIIEAVPLEGSPRFQWVWRAPQAITKPGQVLAAFPSSFNPPTRAHDRLIQGARQVEPIHEIVLMLDRKALDKEIFGASLEDRLSMVLLLCKKDPTLSVAFTNRGRFVEKLTLLVEAYPSDTSIRFIVGYDTLIRILDAKYYENRETALRSLISGAHFLVATRGDVGIEEIREVIHRKENRSFAKAIKPFEIPFSLGQLSSSQAREAISREKPITDMVPPEIASYIQKRGLYRKVVER
jgi:nicotinamide-nucleotide adenylyltransferase